MRNIYTASTLVRCDIFILALYFFCNRARQIERLSKSALVKQTIDLVLFSMPSFKSVFPHFIAAFAYSSTLGLLLWVFALQLN